MTVVYCSWVATSPSFLISLAPAKVFFIPLSPQRYLPTLEAVSPRYQSVRVIGLSA